jgi:hypothetical protein
VFGSTRRSSAGRHVDRNEPRHDHDNHDPPDDDHVGANDYDQLRPRLH